MHQIAFATKRAFHGFLRGTRKLLAAHGLTAARFDLLYALVGDGPIDGGSQSSYQSTLRTRVGVSAPVVSRMLGALERLGWIRREKERNGDRRQRIVRLTAEGRSRLLAARRVILRSVERLVTAAICFLNPRDPMERLVNMDSLEGYLRVLRRDFGDRATLYFPWGHPDD
ncbi:MAG: MarR family winged helix-turn-helix transcriptional regulator [Polyangiaceae bacterium]